MKSFVTKGKKIEADASGNVPTVINLLKTGSWHTPWHGDFELTADDLREMASNFKQGVGLVVDDPEGPINYFHEGERLAAGWIKSVYVDLIDGVDSLMANVEWTPAGEQKIKDKELKYISSEFNPRGFPWEDPEEEFHFVENVVTAAALTNIPLFKRNKPVMASRLPSRSKKADATSGDDVKKVNKGDTMDLAEVRAKKLEDLSDEEKAFLADHKTELTDEERKTFELEDAPVVEDDEVTEDPDKEGGVKASAKPVSISADRLAKLEASAQRADELAAKLDSKEVDDIVDGAIKAGQIKADSRADWHKQILASSGDSREGLTKLLNSLPKNTGLDTELGSDKSGVTASATSQVYEKAQAMVKADASLNIRDAVIKVQKEDPELAKQFKEEGNR